ncbi:MAG TPA: DNA mismatch repair protein MutS [Syntrophobacteraceae bacterium]|nr:DNA mismatch repair protein MutS [Syntrophobacteraceae bacterium]
MNDLTPMMQQYLEIKSRYPESLLLYRMGDFYEMFMEDALTASKVLDIALTSRDRQAENPVPMCGVPYHAAESYIARLVSAGYKIAICDQVEDPKQKKGLVRREVTRVLTPGLIVDTQNLTSNQPNYLAAVWDPGRAKPIGLAFLDISTAEFRITELDSPENLIEELIKINPKEILLPEEFASEWVKSAQSRLDVAFTHVEEVHFDKRRAQERLTSHFQVHSLDGFGIGGMDSAIQAAGAVLAYVHENLFGSCEHIKTIRPYSRSEFMVLDEATVKNLEIFYSPGFQGRKGSLIDVVDRTRTAMGGRRLQQWLRYPLLDLRQINDRQDATAELAAQSGLRETLLELLEGINDIERLNARNSTGVSTPRDLIGLKKSLQALPSLAKTILAAQSAFLAGIASRWDSLEDLAAHLQAALCDPPPATLSNGGAINAGFDPELGRLVRLSRDAKGWMAEYEALQRRETGISSLKVRYNKVFGYYIEISRSNLSSAPLHYHRKQTLVNAERFITEELKEFEVQVLEADEKRLELEERLFVELRRWVSSQSERIQNMADIIADLDCLASLAELAAKCDYCKPEVDTGDSIHIRDGRHPVIERFLPQGSFVPNDLDLDREAQQVLIVTGPNMAGKSTILRQAALIVLLAQIGSFVPASEARMGIVDRIFTRVGASDDLARGRSTFMVEMQETANILHQATPQSLIILDEIGRGTSTFDGMSIAWAVAEFLHDFDGKGVKTLFATHYHELTELARQRPRVKNFNVAIREWRQEILFFHKFVPGSSSRSYGIQVARLAGLPVEITQRAGQILAQLEGGAPAAGGPNLKAKSYSPPKKELEPGVQLSLFQKAPDWVQSRILELDPDSMTPLSALQTLHSLKEEILKNSPKNSPQRRVVGRASKERRGEP